MKRYTLIFIYILMLMPFAYCSNLDYESLYQQAKTPDLTFFNGIDPYQDEDSMKYAWAPYPLFRLSEKLYFKDIVIPDGYYLLTPRTIRGEDYVLFKQNGKVMYTIPVVKVKNTPINFYPTNAPHKEQTFWNKTGQKIADKFNGICKDTKRKKPPQSLLKVENNSPYYVIHLYYGAKCYIMVFRNNRLER